jgi:hypothetical protein
MSAVVQSGRFAISDEPVLVGSHDEAKEIKTNSQDQALNAPSSSSITGVVQSGRFTITDTHNGGPSPLAAPSTHAQPQTVQAQPVVEVPPAGQNVQQAEQLPLSPPNVVKIGRFTIQEDDQGATGSAGAVAAALPAHNLANVPLAADLSKKVEKLGRFTITDNESATSTGAPPTATSTDALSVAAAVIADKVPVQSGRFTITDEVEEGGYGMVHSQSDGVIGVDVSELQTRSRSNSANGGTMYDRISSSQYEWVGEVQEALSNSNFFEMNAGETLASPHVTSPHVDRAVVIDSPRKLSGGSDQGNHCRAAGAAAGGAAGAELSRKVAGARADFRQEHENTSKGSGEVTAGPKAA